MNVGEKDPIMKIILMISIVFLRPNLIEIDDEMGQKIEIKIQSAKDELAKMIKEFHTNHS